MYLVAVIQDYEYSACYKSLERLISVRVSCCVANRNPSTINKLSEII